MPSIADLFGVNPEEVDPNAVGGDFDIDKMLEAADGIIASHTDEPTEPVVEPEEEIEPVQPAAAEAPVEAPVVEQPVVSSDPLSELPPERRAAMLNLDQILTTNPEKRDAILRVLAGEPEVEQEPEIRFPEGIDPASFEGQMWSQTQETRRAVAQIAQQVGQQQVATQQQQAADHARTAAAAFGAKHPELEQADVFEIARYAGNSGIAGAFVEANRAQPVAQLEQAFESVLFSNETFRNKVIAAPAPVVPGETPEAVVRKKNLTALSSGASPVASGPAQSEQLESRPDGRLTPKSRQQAVAEVAAGLLRQRKGF